jgi:EmrB/QacA subfamily drug resistance transporter
MTAERTGLRANPMAALTVLSLGLFMTLLDVTIVNIAIPQLVDSLGASLDEALWVQNAYVLVLGVCLITAGRLGDIFGPRSVFLVGTALFTAASVLCGVASSAEMLIAARALQGIGAALLTPQPLAIVLPLFPPERRGSAFAVNGIVAGVAAMAGPTVGGLIVTHWDWRGIFFVNVPVGLLSIALTLWIVPDLRPGRRHRLDLSGVAVATLALTAITFALTEGQRYDWGGGIVALLVVGALLLGVFVWLQRRRQTGEREPLIPFALFHDRNFTLMIIVGGAMQLGMTGLFLPFTIYLQSVLGLSALQAGLVFVPSSALSMVLTPLVGRLVDRIGGKFILMAGLALFGIGMAVIDVAASVDSSRWAFVPGVLITGAGLSGIFVPMVTVAMAEVQPRLAGAASGLLNTTRQLGGVLGGALVGALLQNRLAVALHDEALARADEVPAAARAGFVRGFEQASEGGLEVGAGQAASQVRAPAGAPDAIADQIGRVAGDVFHHAFVDALHPTLLLPIVVLLLAAAACLGVRGRGRPSRRRVAQPAPAAAA